MDKNKQGKLVKLISKGDSQAREELLNFMEPLVHKVAEKYRKKTNLAVDVLQAAGVKGVEKAIKLWPKRKNRKYRFSVYALWFVRQGIIDRILKEEFD